MPTSTPLETVAETSSAGRHSHKPSPLRATRMPRAERREQLLEAARALARTSGVDALTMSALAEQAGVSKPVVYEHFTNSEDVALALLDACFEGMVRRVHERTGGAPTLQDYMATVVDCHCEAARNGELTTQAFTNGMTRGHAVGDRLNARFQEIRARSAGTIQEMLEQQGAETGAARITGQILFDVLNSSLLTLDANEDPELVATTLKALTLAMIDRVIQAPSVPPHTPQAILDDAERVRARLDGAPRP